jgi:hypothetical protein
VPDMNIWEMGGFRKEAVDTLVANIVALWALLDDEFKSPVGCKYKPRLDYRIADEFNAQQVGHVRYEIIGPIQYEITKYYSQWHIDEKCKCDTHFTVQRCLREKPDHWQSAEIKYLPLPYTIEDCTTDRIVGNLLIRAWGSWMIPGWNL